MQKVIDRYNEQNTSLKAARVDYPRQKIDEAALEYIAYTESKKTKHLLERNTTETFIGWCCPSCRFT